MNDEIPFNPGIEDYIQEGARKNQEWLRKRGLLPERSQGEPAKPGSLHPVVGAHDLMRTGGKWLAAAREWLQWHTINGDSVTWGSSDEIRPTFTVKMVEELAAHVAAAAINSERERVRSNAPHERRAGNEQ